MCIVYVYVCMCVYQAINSLVTVAASVCVWLLGQSQLRLAQFRVQ